MIFLKCFSTLAFVRFSLTFRFPVMFLDIRFDVQTDLIQELALRSSYVSRHSLAVCLLSALLTVISEKLPGMVLSNAGKIDKGDIVWHALYTGR